MVKYPLRVIYLVQNLSPSVRMMLPIPLKEGPTTSPQKLHVNQAICKMPNSEPAFLVNLTAEKEKADSGSFRHFKTIPLCSSHSQKQLPIDPLSQCSKAFV